MNLWEHFKHMGPRAGHDEPPPQSRFIPIEHETPELPPRNRAERRAKRRDRVRANRAEMRAQGRRAHLRRKSLPEIFGGFCHDPRGVNNA